MPRALPTTSVRATLVSGHNPSPYTGSGNNTYLLEGRVPTLIDAATGAVEHLDAVAAILGGRPLARVLVTHGHPDHASGSRALASRWPGVEFFKMPWPERDATYPVRWQPVYSL